MEKPHRGHPKGVRLTSTKHDLLADLATQR